MTGCRAEIEAPGCRALVQFVPHEVEGRLRAIDVILKAHDVLDVRIWRAFPLARIESRANEPATRRLLLEYANLAELAPVPDVLPTEVEGRMSLTVARPVRPPYPDTVYKTVASHYRWCVRWGHPPAQVIAEFNDVPTSTVYGWISEARRRGFLEPGRPGRAG
jgi:hypothetical protein